MNKRDEIKWDSAECTRARIGAFILMVVIFAAIYYIIKWNFI